MHTIVIVEMPSLKDITDAIDQDVAAAEAEARADQTASMEEDSETIPPFTDRSLPLLFVRRSDGLGYHSGRSIACDAVPPQPDGSPAVPPILDSNWQTLLPDPLIPGGQWAMRIM
jgi:recombining binding protein (suppressor of hairless)